MDKDRGFHHEDIFLHAVQPRKYGRKLWFNQQKRDKHGVQARHVES